MELQAWEIVVGVLAIVSTTSVAVSAAIWKLSGDKGKAEERITHLEKDYDRLNSDFATLHKRIDSRESEIRAAENKMDEMNKTMENKMDEMNKTMNKMHIELLTAIHAIDKKKEDKDA